MIKVTFPDGAVRDYARGTTGTTVVEGISPSLAKKTVAMKWNGVLTDLSDPLNDDGKIEFVMRDSADGLGLIRHDAAHVLAEAVQELWPDDAGHHRPGDRERLLLRLQARHAVQRGRIPGDRKEDEGDRRSRRRLHQGSLVPRRGQARLRQQGRELQGRAGRRHPGRPVDQDLSRRASGSTSAAARTCARPRMSARRSS